MDWHLAQVNISRFRKPVEDPANADFVNALQKVNAIADRSAGFVWRFQGRGLSAALSWCTRSRTR